ncbi:hypothetical protein SY212_04140 [Ligilactobacillus agilis]|uniref:Uncharacterized protein n=1 Tax=Ligilactobacillus agilis TaxID=1601 RepID=A0A6F9XJE8_9LACO|nr:hypothetical protein [Ligilactobacillus agilis]GET05384.1 hypothetical protein SY212_04140 [Ligilactobacillus agilis]
MENNLFVATMLDCGIYDVNNFFERLNKYENTVFFNDDDFSYERVIENVRDDYDEFTINTLNKEIDRMAIVSALEQVGSSEEFRVAVWNGFKYYYNYACNKFWFDNIKELKSFDEWKEFASLLGL